VGHLDALYDFYGPARGVRIARKHIQWFCQDQPDREGFWEGINRLECAKLQRRQVERYFDDLLGYLPTAA
jgi:tRNA-dihydrouridine synthase B